MLVATILHAIYDQKRVLNSMTKKRYRNYCSGALRQVPVDLFAAFEACRSGQWGKQRKVAAHHGH